MNVDKEWQIRGKICVFRVRDDEKYVVVVDYFVKFCKVLSFDFNIEEGIIDSKIQLGKGQIGNVKGCFRFSDKYNVVYNLEFCKVDLSVRLLLR